MVISIDFIDKKLEYAAKELKFYLDKYSGEEIILNAVDSDKRIALEINETIPSHCYGMHSSEKLLTIYGGNFSSLLCGIYEALEEAGIFFEITDSFLAGEFDLKKLFSVSKTVSPKFRLRGIRQHINFPMDISSYSLNEAKEYIRAASRMKYNAITFHSYPGQWHEIDAKGKKDCAGHFFFGQKLRVPKEYPSIAKLINNKEIYCIPECEPLFNDEKAKGEFAKNFLRELIKTAKEVGFTVTLSVEITFDGDAEIISMLNSVCKLYPEINTLEIISEECGGYREMPELTMENVTDFMVSAFGSSVLDADGKVIGLKDYIPHQLGATAISVRRALRALSLRESWLQDIENKPDLRVGIYATCLDTLRILRPIMKAAVPDGISLSLLPAHGSVTVSENIQKSGTDEKDWQNTMFYSWAEFDGNMFVLQTSTDGIEKTVNLSPSDSSYGISFNHWRTADNKLTIAYAAKAAVYGTSAKDFYIDYAEKIGVSDPEKFKNVCDKLAKADTYACDNLYNIGFCFVECWINWCKKGAAVTPRGFSEESIKNLICKYEEIISDFDGIRSKKNRKKANDFIDLMKNRARASILHLYAMAELDNIFKIYDYDSADSPSAEKLKEIQKIISRSKDYALQYLSTYGEILSDRGCEGMLVSYCDTVLTFIDVVGSNFIHDATLRYANDYDAPPMPD